MATREMVRAWKDEEYRLSLSEAEMSLLPENPAGSLELTDAELEQVAGEGTFCSIVAFTVQVNQANVIGGGGAFNYTYVSCKAFKGFINQATQVNNAVVIIGT